MANIDKQIEKTKSLPLRPKEDWIMERRPIDIEVEELGDVTPDVLVCVSTVSGLVIGANVIGPDTPPSEIISWALDCMLSPMAGKAGRPASLTLVGLKDLQMPMKQLGIEVAVRSIPHPIIDEVISVLESNMSNPGIPPYLFETKLKPEMVADFFIAASEFYRAKPWALFEYEIPIRIRLEFNQPVDYWLVIMGVEEETFGLALYRSAEDAMNIFDAEDDEEALRISNETWSMSLTFESVDDIGPAAQAEYVSNQWQIVGESAYPSVLVIEPTGKELARRPNQKEIKNLTVVTRAITRFVQNYPEEIRNEELLGETIEVETDKGKLQTVIFFPAPEFIELEEDDSEVQG